MANTHVSLKFVVYLWTSIKSHISIRVFRWVNIDAQRLTPGQDYEHRYTSDLDKIMVMEIRQTKVKSKGLFINPFIGDLSRELVEAVYKCIHWDRPYDNGELT